MANTVRERIRRSLKKRHQTQQDLAVALGISPAYLSQILSGKRKASLQMALALEAQTGVPARDFAEVA